MAHESAVRVAVMIANPTEENRKAAVEALIVAPEEEYQASINAFVTTYGDKAEPLRILLAGLRKSNAERA